MTVEIRQAAHEDIPGVQHVAELAWDRAHTPIVGADTTAAFLDQYYSRTALEGLVESDDRIDLVADAGETVVGFVFGGPTEHSARLMRLGRAYVLPERWGNGIGRRLVGAFEQRAAGRGDGVSLRVMADNDRAIGFYESAGYSRVGQLYDETVETDAYLYWKSLEE